MRWLIGPQSVTRGRVSRNRVGRRVLNQRVLATCASVYRWAVVAFFGGFLYTAVVNLGGWSLLLWGDCGRVLCVIGR